MAMFLLIVVVFNLGYLVGHYEGCRCLCPKRPYPWLRQKANG
jgi:hypothetical protein